MLRFYRYCFFRFSALFRARRAEPHLTATGAITMYTLLQVIAILMAGDVVGFWEASFILEVGPLMAVGVYGLTFLVFYAALGRESRRSEINREFESDEAGGLRFAYSAYLLGTPAVLIVVGLLLIYVGSFAGTEG